MQTAYGWPLLSDSATLSGGNWTLALTNAQLSPLSSVARSTGDANADTIINVDFGSAKTVGVVAIVRHNLRSAARWRIRGSAASDMSGALYDSQSGGINPLCWPEQWASGVLPAGHPNASTRLYTDAQINALNPPRDVVHVLSTQTAARYWRVEFFDTANTDDYVQMARFVMAPLYVTTTLPEVGAEFGFADASSVGRTLSGAQFVDERPKARTLSLRYVNATDAEAVTVLRDMQEQLGVAGQVYCVSDTSDTHNLQRRSFLANFKTLSPLQYGAAGYSTYPVSLEEVR
jgi:hypothetical protein